MKIVKRNEGKGLRLSEGKNRQKGRWVSAGKIENLSQGSGYSCFFALLASNCCFQIYIVLCVPDFHGQFLFGMVLIWPNLKCENYNYEINYV